MPEVSRIAPDRPAARGWNLLYGIIPLLCFTQLGCLVFHKKGDTDIVRSVQLPGSAKATFEKAVKAYNKGNLDEAIVGFERTIELDPSHGRAHNNLGLLYFERHQLSLAASHFETAAQLMSGDATPVNNLGMTLEKGGRLHEANELYERASRINPSNPLYLGNLVRGKMKLGDQDDLLRAQMQALLMIETRPEWIYWIEDHLALTLNPLLDRGGSQTELASGTQSDATNPQAVSPEQPLPEPIELNGPSTFAPEDGIEILPEGQIPMPYVVPSPEVPFDASQFEFFEVPP